MSFARAPQTATVSLSLYLGHSEFLLAGQIRWIRPLDGEATRDQGRVEEMAAQEYVAEETVETIATFDVELNLDPLTLQTSLSERRGFFSEAFGGLVRVCNFGSIHADESDALRPAVEEHADGVAVHDLGYRNGRP